MALLTFIDRFQGAWRCWSAIEKARWVIISRGGLRLGIGKNRLVFRCRKLLLAGVARSHNNTKFAGKVTCFFWNNQIWLQNYSLFICFSIILCVYRVWERTIWLVVYLKLFFCFCQLLLPSFYRLFTVIAFFHIYSIATCKNRLICCCVLRILDFILFAYFGSYSLFSFCAPPDLSG